MRRPRKLGGPYQPEKLLATANKTLQLMVVKDQQVSEEIATRLA